MSDASSVLILTFLSPIRRLESQGDILRVETEMGVYFIGPKDWVAGVGSRLTWRARLRLRLCEGLAWMMAR